MSATAHCSKCGAPVSDEVAGGFCTACLLEEGLAPADLKEAPITRKYFGDYELLEEIARGGMGVVFKARQRSLNRIVAVKMILSGHLASEAEAQRFRAEARAGAALQHPGIVAIHEVGEHEGLLFFSMDYVEGRDLAQLVRDGPLPARRAAECVREIAEAIHYAHERGVLHRDLKPSNVLIDSNGRPHVTDFGLAKQLTPDFHLSTSAHQLTLSGQVLGSPNFMPPEQAAGKHRELTPASDVYSLGALLYHLITGRPPFLADSIPATLRLVSETEAVAPRLLVPGVPRDLETICLKCLEKDPKRRYATAQELSEELERFLNHEPILARPINAMGRLSRWARRNPSLARAAVTTLVLFVALAVGGPIAFLQVNRARQNADVRQKEAALEAIKSQQIAQFFKDMLKTVGPSVALGRDTKLLREILDNTATRLSRDLTNQPMVEAELRETIGRVYWELGDYSQAEAMQRRVLALRRQIHGSNHLETANSLTKLGAIIGNFSRYEEAERLVREALAIQTNLITTDHADVAYSLNNLGVQLSGQNKNAEAEAVWKRALAMRERLFGRTNREVAITLGNLAGCDMERNPAKAEAQFREVIAMFEALFGKSHPELETPLDNLANTLVSQRRLTEAEDVLRRALTMQTNLMGKYHPHNARSLGILFGVLKDQNKLPEAELVSRYLVELCENMFGRWDDRTQTTRNELHALLIRQGKPAEAQKLKEETLAQIPAMLATLETSSSSNEWPVVITRLGAAAAILDDAHQYAQAESLLQRRLGLQQQLYGSNDLQIADSLGRMAGTLDKDGKHEEAERLLERKLAIQKLHFRSGDSNVMETLERQANNFELQQKWEQAETVAQELFTARKQVLGESDPKTVAALARLSSVMLNQKKSNEAQLLDQKLGAIAKKAVALPPNLASNNVPQLIDTLSGLAEALDHAHKYSMAADLIEQRLARERQLYGKDDPRLSAALNWVAWLYFKDKRRDEEAGALAERLAVQRKQFGPDHTNTLSTLDRLISAVESEGKTNELEFLLRDSWRVRRSAWGDAHSEAIRAQARLVSLLLQQRRGTEAAATWSELIALNPTNAAALIARGEIYGRAGRFKEAIADFSRARVLNPSSAAVNRVLATLLVHRGDTEAYHQFRQQILAHFSDTKDPGTADTTAKACLLLPLSGTELEAAAALADRAVSLGEKNELSRWFRLCKSLSEYRRGHFSDAIDWADKVFGSSRPIPERDAAARLLIAMAERQMKAEGARAALNQAKEFIAGKLPKLDAHDLGAQWSDRLIVDILLREAEGLELPPSQ